MLPDALRSLILDYAASLTLFEQKQRLHKELHHRTRLQEMRCFYRVFHSFTVSFAEVATQTYE